VLHVGGDDASPFNIVGDTDNDSLIAVKPQTNFFAHGVCPFLNRRCVIRFNHFGAVILPAQDIFKFGMQQ
jgi:hypothetical protein